MTKGVRSSFVRWTGGSLLVVAVGLVGGWVLLYPSPDPKNIRYVLWKAGVGTMDLDVATGVMVGDSDPKALVVGQTKERLRARFGVLRPPSDASPYLQGCYRTSPWAGRDVAFLRSSPWMVVFSGETATELVLIKGC